ncbi:MULTISPECIES: amidohydrolase [unclassified Microbacterium]|uniref:amidohydrolase n=1 Tax=unclassified Microbacterium TaxID=2609290 RepID=UPI003019E52E
MTDPADLVVRNARVHTLDDASSVADAFAVRDGRVVAVGADAEMGALIGPATLVEDLDGAVVIPGLVDAHNHHSAAGRAELFECSFPDTAGVDEIVAAVAQWAGSHPDDEWIVGGAWGSGLFGALTDPAALAALDAASGGKKVLLADDSLHNRWANTAAMTAAGITRDSPDPQGGQILRDPSGALTGVLIEAAGALVEVVRAEATPADAEFWARCSARGIEIMNERGITAFMDASASEGLMAGLALLDERGELSAWAVSAMLVNDFIFGTSVLGDDLFAMREQFRTPHHLPDFAKIFLDGVPPAYTAAFLEPYRDGGPHGACFHGTTTMPPEELLGWLRNAGGRGIGVKVHCTGDASVRYVLDAVETVRSEGVDVIFHIAHGQFIAPDDVPRLARLGVVAEISPALWSPSVIMDALESVLEPDVMARIHPNRDLLDAGTTVACGSDWPVSPDPNPWAAISSLVTRADPYGVLPGTVAIDQAIAVREALHAYTRGGAAALGLSDRIGTIEVGKSADFAVIDRDPFTVDPADLATTRTLATWFAGSRVFAAA